MSINLRGIQVALENKLEELDKLKSSGWDHEFDVLGEEEAEMKGEFNTMSLQCWDNEVQGLRDDICCLFDSFKNEIDSLSHSGINTERYNCLFQNLKRDYTNICNYIESRRRRFNLFSKSNISSGSKYQKLYVDKDSTSLERSQLYREKNSLIESISNISSVIDQAINTSQSLNNQKRILKHVLDKTRTMRKKSISEIQSIAISIINLKMKQNVVIAIALISLIAIVYFIR
ncbi:transmembrane domain-containing protein [Cryptosporidium canis]|uniref:Transmembrane domain-containing protein n=1 Tax=Cryptosporidium canis TaxID=195482 RepID=A0A9D5DE21_9CRYT|nr:transmembrane domain-containing protein [Cryptosporidium canis]